MARYPSLEIVRCVCEPVDEDSTLSGGLWECLVPAGFYTLLITVLHVQVVFKNWLRFWFIASDFEVGRHGFANEVRSQ